MGPPRDGPQRHRPRDNRDQNQDRRQSKSQPAGTVTIRIVQRTPVAQPMVRENCKVCGRGLRPRKRHPSNPGLTEAGHRRFSTLQFSSSSRHRRLEPYWALWYKWRVQGNIAPREITDAPRFPYQKSPRTREAGMHKRIALLILAFGVLVSTAQAGNWGHWRGPTGNSTAPDATPPTQWSTTKNVKWKVELAGSREFVRRRLGPASVCNHRRAAR